MTLSFTETRPSNPIGEPVVILHGLFGSRRNWVSIAKALSENYPVFTVDMPNHGESDWLETITYEVMAEEVADFLNQHDLQGATLMGHSMGGKTAMTLALSQGDMIGKLIVADIAPVTYDHDNATNVSAMEVVDLTTVTSRSDADKQMSTVVADPMLRAFFLQNLVRDGDAFKWRINLAAIKNGLGALHGFPSFDSAFDKPTLFVAGAESHYIKPDYQPQIDGLFPGATLKSIPGAQHWLHADKPAEYTAIVQEFLAA